jgi:hypothetical protein
MFRQPLEVWRWFRSKGPFEALVILAVVFLAIVVGIRGVGRGMDWLAVGSFASFATAQPMPPGPAPPPQSRVPPKADETLAGKGRRPIQPIHTFQVPLELVDSLIPLPNKVQQEIWKTSTFNITSALYFEEMGVGCVEYYNEGQQYMGRTCAGDTNLPGVTYKELKFLKVVYAKPRSVSIYFIFCPEHELTWTQRWLGLGAQSVTSEAPCGYAN